MDDFINKHHSRMKDTRRLANKLMEQNNDVRDKILKKYKGTSSRRKHSVVKKQTIRT